MSRVVSISRRTDVPAFYGSWFERRLDEGFAGWENPFGGKRYLVSLKREDVAAMVFWSKNYRTFLPVLKRLRTHGYPVVFNYTITGLPQAFECNVVPVADALDSILEMSRTYSPDHINWRYDPVVVSDITPPEYHERRFSELCGRLHGYVRRCYFSYAMLYGKVERNFTHFETAYKVRIQSLSRSERIALAGRLAKIAAAHEIEMFTCCGDYLIGGGIKKAHCIDGDLISRIYYGGNWHGAGRPTREECGCTESVDVGKYDTCPHGCVYCYANINKDQAVEACKVHDVESAFLGRSKADSDRFLSELRQNSASPDGMNYESRDAQLRFEL